MVSYPDIALFETKWTSITSHSTPTHQQPTMEKLDSVPTLLKNELDGNMKKIDKEKVLGKESLQTTDTCS